MRVKRYNINDCVCFIDSEALGSELVIDDEHETALLYNHRYQCGQEVDIGDYLVVYDDGHADILNSEELKEIMTRGRK